MGLGENASLKFINLDDRRCLERPRSPRSCFFFLFYSHINSQSSFKRRQNTRGCPRGAPWRVQMLLKSSSWGPVDRSLWVTGLGPGSYSPLAFEINIQALKQGRGAAGVSLS